MRWSYFFTCVTVFFLHLSLTLGQNLQDTTIVLDGVWIKDTRIKKNATRKRMQIDEIKLKENFSGGLHEILSFQTPVFIKQNGINGTASPVFRGTGSNHTQVYWEGIHLNSPTLGQTDLSLFPVAFMDEIEVLYGSSSLSLGTGGLGGAIQFNTKADWDTERLFKVSQTLGSFSNHNTYFKSILTKGDWQSATRVFYKKGENDFEYTDLEQAGHPVVKMKHAEIKQYGLMQGIYFKPDNYNDFSSKCWAQFSERGIPSALTASGAGLQKDKTFRWVSGWDHHDPSYNWSVKAGYLRDAYDYLNLKTQVASEGATNTLQLNQQFTWLASDKWIFNAHAFLTHAQTKGTDVEDPENEELINYNQDVLNLSMGGEWKATPLLTLNFSATQPFVDYKAQLFLPSLGGAYQFHPRASWRFNLSRNFRQPTLNDLYYFPLGNPNIKAEESRAAENSFVFKSAEEAKLNWDYTLTGFYTIVDHWILWTPADGPVNIPLVHSRGIENALNTRFKLNDDWRFKLHLAYAYTHAISKEKIYANDASEGAQLMYTPKHNFQAAFDIHYKQAKLGIENSYYSKRYTDREAYHYLPAYTLTNLVVSWQKSINKHQYYLQFRANNLFGFHYYSVPNMPMPTQNFRISFHYQFKQEQP